MNFNADLLKHCGETPEIVKVYYPGTKYRMYIIRCKKCGISTGDKRRLDDAIREWNNPYIVKLN